MRDGWDEKEVGRERGNLFSLLEKIKEIMTVDEKIPSERNKKRGHWRRRGIRTGGGGGEEGGRGNYSQ